MIQATAATDPQAAIKAGKCFDCGGPLYHGPWSADQIDEAAADIGMPPEDFVDTCDRCFVRDVARGDLAYAEALTGRKLAV